MSLYIYIVLVAFAILGCGGGDDSGSSNNSGGGNIEYGSVADNNGKTYKTVKIGNQTWMAENLDYATEDNSSKCYDNNESNCEIYGRLYDWATAMALPSSCNTSSCSIGEKHRGICPSGWHIPNKVEWTTLTDIVGSSAGTKLKANSNLWDTNTGTDNYGFAALPGGWCDKNGSFSKVGHNSYWWGSSENDNDATEAYRRDMYHNGEDVSEGYFNKSRQFSVRCLKN